MTLVIGSTGYLGGEICRRLVGRGKRVRGLVRSTSDPERIAMLRSMGVELVEGDLKDRASLDAACDGATAVVSTATSTRTRQEGDSIESTDGAGQANLVAAAQAAGVERYVYVSYSGQVGLDDPLTNAKRSVERHVRESGMTYTILRPSFFMEVWLSPHLGFDAANARARIYGNGQNPISAISLTDVAEFAVRALEEPAAENTVIELGGPEALSPNDIVRIFEEATGRRFDVEYIPEEALRSQQASATDSLQKAFTSLMLAFAHGDPIPMERTLQQFPIRLKSVREFAAEVVQGGIA
jgi:uncharacterized protein YbjT (DUF2867 family)